MNKDFDVNDLKLDIDDLELLDVIFFSTPTKDVLSELFEVTPLTIHNKLKKFPFVSYSKKQSCYIFTSMLPEFVSPKTLEKLTWSEIEDSNMRRFLSDFFNRFYSYREAKLIRTCNLPSIIQKIITIKHAINHKIEIRIEYNQEKKEILPLHYNVYNDKKIILTSNEEILDINFIKNIEFIKYTKQEIPVSGDYILYNNFGLTKYKKPVKIHLDFKISKAFKANHPKSWVYNYCYEDDNGDVIDLFCIEEELEYFLRKYHPYAKVQNN